MEKTPFVRKNVRIPSKTTTLLPLTSTKPLLSKSSAAQQKQQIEPILGTKRWNQNYITTSTGISSLDDVLGGGIPLHTILTLVKDENYSYYSHFLQSFIAEGIIFGHSIIVVASHSESILHYVR